MNSNHKDNAEKDKDKAEKDKEKDNIEEKTVTEVKNILICKKWIFAPPKETILKSKICLFSHLIKFQIANLKTLISQISGDMQEQLAKLKTEIVQEREARALLEKEVKWKENNEYYQTMFQVDVLRKKCQPWFGLLKTWWFL